MNRTDANRIDLSIVIIGWNIQSLVRQVMNSTKLIQDVTFEVIYVDNGSDDDTLKIFTEEYPDTIIVRNPRDLGFAGANNRGIPKAHGRYIFLLNSDTELLPGTIEKCISFMDAHTDVGVLGAELLNTDGSLQGGYSTFPTVRSFIRSLTGQIREDYQRWRENYSSEPKSRQVDWISGADLLIRREVIEQVGMLDERFFFYVEEVEFCLRVTQAGWKIYFLSDAKIYHHHRQTTGKADKHVSLFTAHNVHSQQIYAWRHFNLLEAALLMLLSLAYAGVLILKGLLKLFSAPEVGQKYLRNGFVGIWYAFEALLVREKRVPRLSKETQ